MALAVGTRLGVFEVTGALGAGGMGEVYRARDSGLKRDVALKILPAALAADPDRVARFQREAELLATLAHPHIAAIHGLVEADGVRALVLELVPGETLADRVARGPIPVDEALALARQLADALDYAHEHGVVHRDLKPANLKVTPDGQLKVLDFGLAKALEGPHPFSAEAAHSPTLTSPAMTQAGMLLGTAAYMSPEQARGKPVDKRADIWAFGAVLYELLTGVRAFEGETVSDTLAAVLKSEPDWARLPVETPASLRTLLRHCLARDMKERLRDIGDARRELAADAAAPIGSTAHRLVTPSRAGRWVPWAVAVALGAALVGVVVGWAPWTGTRPAPVQRLSVELGVHATLRADRGTAAVLSPDGQVLAFSAYPRETRESFLFVRRLDQLAATQLPGTQDAISPFFSPDGTWIAFFAEGKLKKVETRGGTPIVLCDAPNPRGGHWTSDGRVVFLPAVGGGQRLHQVSESGGIATPYIEPDPDAGQRWPYVLRDGRAVVYTRNQPGVEPAIYIQTLPDGERRLLRQGAYGRVLESGYFLHVEGGALYAARFDMARLSIVGEPVRIVEGIAVNAADGAQFAASDAGQLVYLAGKVVDSDRPIQWLDATGTIAPLAGPVDWVWPQFSPDGRRLAYTVPLGGIWLFDVDRGVRATVVNAESRPAQGAAWTPDGQRIVFAAADAGRAPNLYWRRVDGLGPTQRLAASPYQQSQPSWHPNGRVLAFQQATPPTNDIMVMALDGNEHDGWRPGEPEVFAGGSAIEIDPAFSADGRWLAYSSQESGRFEVHVRPFPGPGGRVVVSNNGGRFPQWARTERKLFFADSNNTPASIMVVDYVEVDGAFRPGPPRAWTSRRIMPRRLGLNYALHPDGRRIAAQVEDSERDPLPEPDRLVFVTNFFDELRRLAPTGR